MTPEQQKKFKYWQWRTIIGTMVGYIFFYLIRKNFSFAMPGLTAEYGITKASLGIILSLGGFLYGVSKLVNGMLAVDGLISALQKLDEDNSELEVSSKSNAHMYIVTPFKNKREKSNLFSTHPTISQRVIAIRNLE